MTELPTREAYRQCLGQTFRVLPEAAGPVEVELIEVTALPSHSSPAAAATGRPFSLIFRGPLAPFLPQQMYPMENERLGLHTIFIVPIGPDQSGMRYQAIFN